MGNGQEKGTGECGLLYKVIEGIAAFRVVSWEMQGKICTPALYQADGAKFYYSTMERYGTSSYFLDVERDSSSRIMEA